MSARQLLEQLNQIFVQTHTTYERLFWVVYMGESNKAQQMNEAMRARDAFRADPQWVTRIEEVYTAASARERERLDHWKLFFSKYQIPPKAQVLRTRIADLEARIHEKRYKGMDSYVDPYSKKKITVSENQLRSMMRNDDDEKVRKACWQALERKAVVTAGDFVQLVRLRNEFARLLGYRNFYAYKLMVDEGMTLPQLFALWKDIYAKTKYAFRDIRKLERSKPGLRKPWNFSYLMAGDFVKEEDPYFQFENALMWWGRSFAALGYTYAGGTLKLDLLDREGKYSNGFCHYPQTVYERDGVLQPGEAGFTSNLVVGQVGAGSIAMNTLFHEGAHACDRLNSRMPDACLNHEYPPSSTAWAETHSMFADTMFSSIEWKTRYAHNAKGEAYPFELFERKVKKLQVLAPLRMMSIMFVSDFERRVYTVRKLTVNDVKKAARAVSRKYMDLEPTSYAILNVPHIYSWESSCYYQGYGLAELALSQWREYFYKKYGSIVDNPRVGKEVKKMWALSSSRTFPEFVRLATGKPLSAAAFIRSATRSPQAVIRLAKQRIQRLARVPRYTGQIKLDAHIEMWHGKQKIADTSQSFEAMARRYGKWLRGL